ncbi:hypothetical protein V8J88_23350 [Massilia sp. W12]|uniref:hypothetical protein n=1 Tax=Massilia sp. W12 TaxID=3126507 RepID=UPI0030CC61C2
MIRYPFDEQQVRTEIAAIDPNWAQKAAERTRKFLELGRYDEASSIWSTVKPVYMRLQHYKCIYCERQFEDEEVGTIEHDLEHFRPKGAVDVWPDPQRHTFHYDFPTGSASAAGYYWLAYDLLNYCAACKVCNSIYKLNWFPIAAQRLAAPSDIGQLQAEQALLCYPLGNLDDDPEDLISFSATTAIPVHTSGRKHQRAKAIIDFFGLNTRQQLHIQRAQFICLFGYAFEKRHKGEADARDLALLAQIRSPELPHSACLRAFARTWDEKPALAKEIFAQCKAFISSRLHS